MRNKTSFLPTNPIVKTTRQIAALVKPPVVQPSTGANSAPAFTPKLSQASPYLYGLPKTNIT